ncbi:G2/Mitotic-specific cyclin A [Handroanthus impetiginosus]|uniref:G2/Mitotic-specific cyclin A n=1 Tax=Handroanthus impetiginosus TaxID=429701 RepID=A0A2G9GUT0_9LAMI|nr:G2/Mitotic-specific cyclin A [Handroanthus impetiginosus]
MRHAVMNDEDRPLYLKEPNVRITRARAKALGSLGGLPPLYPSGKHDDKVRATSKRLASSDKNPKVGSVSCPQRKKRAVLRDVSNITHQNADTSFIAASRSQHSKQDTKGSLQKKGKVAPACLAKTSQVRLDKRGNTLEDTNKTKVDESQEIDPGKNLRMVGAACLVSKKANSSKHIPSRSLYCREDWKLSEKEEKLEDRGIIDIDSKHEDVQMCSLYAADIYSHLYATQLDRRPLVDYMEKLQRDITQGMRAILIDWLVEDVQMCSLYAADIYSHLYATQLDRRPLVDYMEKLQRDITQGMRAILIDWLVEVSDEYQLVSDTLYLTVNLIDRFLSGNYVEKPKLQLLGVTCMLLASKYEEICASRVEEFCFITDNTYTKEEVVKMESRVLNFLGFQLSVPTTKKFLRRFIQAAQVSYKVPSVELEFLANYLAELTLIEYVFLKFLPSLIAASAVFLARWTLDQSGHPWNPTLEHYTRYKTLDLENIVSELQDLQLNIKGCMLNAIREKYKQPKFKCVSTLRPSKPVVSLFEA